MTVVPCAAISRKREVPKSATFTMSFSVDQHVGRPQVAVDDALRVRVIDGVADLAGEVERAVERRARPFAAMMFSSVSPCTYSITMKNTFVLLLRGGDGDDVGMADAGEQPRLPQQFAEVEALPVRHLDRDLLVDPGVLREVDGAEPAAAEGRDDLVLAERLASEEHAEDAMLIVGEPDASITRMTDNLAHAAAVLRARSRRRRDATTLPADEALHLTRVLRLGEGDRDRGFRRPWTRVPGADCRGVTRPGAGRSRSSG